MSRMETYYEIEAIGDSPTIGRLRYTGTNWVDDNYGYDGSGDTDCLEDAKSIIEREIEGFRITSDSYDYTPETTFIVSHWDEDLNEMIEDYRKVIPYTDHAGRTGAINAPKKPTN